MIIQKRGGKCTEINSSIFASILVIYFYLSIIKLHPADYCSPNNKSKVLEVLCCLGNHEVQNHIPPIIPTENYRSFEQFELFEFY